MGRSIIAQYGSVKAMQCLKPEVLNDRKKLPQLPEKGIMPKL
jgi:hypothetical protein